MKKIGLYLHIPFCISKCLYCDFTSFQSKKSVIEEYIKALLKEIALYSNKLENYIINTIFIGGGTPSILEESQIQRIMESIFKNFNIEKNMEITIESNPKTLNKNKLICYEKVGINRISLGLQTDNNKLLKFLGRQHTFEDFLSTYNLVRKQKFSINIDLMYNLPGQNILDWKRSLKRVAELKPEHISVYSLKLEENTPLFKLHLENSINLPDEKIERAMHHYAIDYLLKKGYIHYEISNFSKKNHECLHNINYWNNGEYLGVGLSASSYINSERYTNTENIKEYINSLNEFQLPIKEKEYKTKSDEIFETIFLNLRLIKGLNISEFVDRFKINPLDIYKKEIEKLQKLKLIEIDDNHIRLTRYGLDVSNQVFLEFLK